ncbi:MAG: hypothetical protein J0M10_04510 [Chitinophagales bacterium]|nr:hypothetical protein [Chitinophagales bacterium]
MSVKVQQPVPRRHERYHVHCNQATEVLVQLRKMSTHILLVVEDNGRGLTEEKTQGIGISNLQSRVQLVEGNLQYDSVENEGTTAIVRVPV